MKQITFSTGNEWVGNEYSSVSPFNCDNSRVLLIHRDHFALHDGAGQFLKDLPIAASQEPRWSRVIPGMLYYVVGNALRKWFVENGGSETIHTFTEYVLISGKGESDISVDGDKFVLSGTRPDGVVEVFIYSLKNGKGPTFPQCHPIDGLKITASNLAIVSYADGSGIWVLDSPPRLLAAFDGHACPATYNGRDVLLWDSAGDPQVNKNALVSIDIESGVMDILADFNWSFAFHISTPLNQPWCSVSLDVPDKTAKSMVMRIPFDKSLPKQTFCETGSIYTGYNSQAKASVSSDGSRIVGCSNFGRTDDPNYCDVWMLDLSAAETRINYAKYLGTEFVMKPQRNGSLDIWVDGKTPIDYAPYAGKTEFVMKPRADGAVDIFERPVA